MYNKHTNLLKNIKRELIEMNYNLKDENVSFTMGHMLRLINKYDVSLIELTSLINEIIHNL